MRPLDIFKGLTSAAEELAENTKKTKSALEKLKKTLTIDFPKIKQSLKEFFAILTGNTEDTEVDDEDTSPVAEQAKQVNETVLRDTNISYQYIKDKEGFSDEAYPDAGKRAVGYGFQTVGGIKVVEGDTITRSEADEEFERQIPQYQNRKEYITVPLTSSQVVALTSFEYNLGSNIRNSTGKKIVTAINAGDLDAASQSMLNHNKSEGKTHPVLVARRKEEVAMLTTNQNYV